jgi:hypothetical protein
VLDRGVSLELERRTVIQAVEECQLPGSGASQKGRRVGR